MENITQYPTLDELITCLELWLNNQINKPIRRLSKSLYDCS